MPSMHAPIELAFLRQRGDGGCWRKPHCASLKERLLSAGVPHITDQVDAADNQSFMAASTGPRSCTSGTSGAQHNRGVETWLAPGKCHHSVLHSKRPAYWLRPCDRVKTTQSEKIGWSCIHLPQWLVSQ